MTMHVELTSFRRFTRNTLRGFLSIRIVDHDLQIFDLTLHEKEGKRWIGLPGKPQIDANGKGVIDARTRKLAYTPTMKFASRLASEQFQSAVLHALDRDGRAA